MGISWYLFRDTLKTLRLLVGLGLFAVNSIVESGVPREWAAAAAWVPSETNSCSFEITSCILSSASFLRFDSLPKIKAK